MPAYVKPEVILRKLKLLMPVMVSLEDPLTREPVTVHYANLHSLLTLDVENMVLERQVIANLYAEMARLSAASEFEHVRAEIRYRKWRARVTDELAADFPEKKNASGKKAAKQGPTTTEMESHYRQHADYEEMCGEGARWKIIAKLFNDLMWAFKMKSEALGAEEKTVGGFAAVVRQADHHAEPSQRLDAYVNIAAEASAITADSGAGQAMADLLADEESQPSSTPPTKPKTPRALS